MSHELDNSWEHLYPAFREKLKQVLAEAKQVTGYDWVMQEGFRSQERQSWLYAQGRTRPGKIVTWMKHPTHHGAGLAADCYPTQDGKTPDFSISHPVYEKFRAIYQKHGLGNGAWAKGDYGHVELIDPAIQAKAEAWVKAGFPAMPEAPTPKVTVNGKYTFEPGWATRIDGELFIRARGLEDAGVAVVDFNDADGSTNIRVLQRP
jgi:hypothetical protein